jgi:hypothetical protein
MNINEMGYEHIQLKTFVNKIMSFHVSFRVGTSRLSKLYTIFGKSDSHNQ